MENSRLVMLISPNEVKAIGQVNYNVNDDTIGYAIRTAQDIYLEDLIGTLLYHRLQELVYNAVSGLEDNIDEAENAEYAILLDEYVEPYLIAKTTVECLLPLTYKVRNVGVTKNTDSNILASQLQELQYVLNYNNTQVAHYATRLSKYLCENKSLFPELNVKGNCCGKKARIGREYANNAIFFGGGGGCCK